MSDLNVNADVYSYGSRRTVVYGRHGMVATSQPLAAQAGLRAIEQGGNAIDAAVAAAAALTVVEPTSNGIGSDAFAIVWTNNRLYGLNSSGPAPRGLTVGWVKERGWDAIPSYGWPAVTVPGAPAAWQALSSRFGRLSMSQTLQSAVDLARFGYPVSPTVATGWSYSVQRYREVLTEDCFRDWFHTFAPHNRAPAPGEIWRSPDHANTLQEIGRSDAAAFYRGPLAESMVKFSNDTGGVLAIDDLRGFRPEWVDPLAVSFRDYDVWELPPNGQGLVALIALQLLEGLHPTTEEERVHYQIEALKLGFSDLGAHVGDPKSMHLGAEDFLTESYARKRRSLIGPTASVHKPGQPLSGGTVYLATADGEGNMVSFIQSNFRGFGSGLVVPGTGIALQNRGELFTLEDGHPNRLEPGKRPLHTIIPGFITKAGMPVGPFGVMGGFMQPQGHVQVLSRVLDENMNPQAALDAPRFYWKGGKAVAVEPTMPLSIQVALKKRGHEVEVEENLVLFGRGEIIWRSDDGVLCGATEPRADGQVAVY